MARGRGAGRERRGLRRGTRPPCLCVCACVCVHRHACTHEHMVGRRGGEAGSQGARAGCPKRGLCSQAQPEGKGVIHTRLPHSTEPQAVQPAAPEPSFPGQLLRKRDPLPLARKVSVCTRELQTHPLDSRSCWGSSHPGAPRPSILSAFLLPRKFIFKKRRGHLRWDPHPLAGSTTGVPDRTNQRETLSGIYMVKRERRSHSGPPGAGGQQRHRPSGAPHPEGLMTWARLPPRRCGAQRRAPGHNRC